MRDLTRWWRLLQDAISDWWYARKVSCDWAMVGQNADGIELVFETGQRFKNSIYLRVSLQTAEALAWDLADAIAMHKEAAGGERS